jgi:PAS domain S-box-containing protein
MSYYTQYINAIEENNIVSKTDIDGIITFVNDEFCKISGYKKEELIGKNHNIVRHPDVPKETFKKLWDTIKSKKTYKSTVKNRAKNGDVFYVNSTVFPILDDDGYIVEFVAIRYDVTKEILLQKKITQNDKVLVAQSRLATMGEMLANIAHQWRQPLNELSIVLYTAKRKFDQDGDPLFDQAKQIINRMSTTIDDFSDFFRPNKDKEWFVIENVLKDTFYMVKNTLSKESIELVFKPIKGVKLYGYPSELAQVFVNIINNSKDAFGLREDIKDRYIVVRVVESKSSVTIEIEDNAGGIDEQMLPKIFEPYFTTKHSSQGTGIGLYMSKMIVEDSMKGYIDAKNSKNGAIFIIKIDKIQKESHEM